jgi:hypothetical protein
MSEEKHSKLILLPQSGVIIEPDLVSVSGEIKPSQWIVAMKGVNQGAVVPSGDRVALIAELKKRGLLTEVEIPREVVEAEQKEEAANAITAPTEMSGKVQIEKA